MRRKLAIALLAVIAIALIGYAAHTFDLVGMLRSLHGLPPQH